jgi:signal transduction histidine kinase
MLRWPDHLRLADKRATLDEATSAIRHDLANKLGSIRNSVFFIRRKVEKIDALTADERIRKFFELIDEELDGCSELVAMRGIQRSDATAEVNACIRELVPRDAACTLALGPDRVVFIAPDDLGLALLSLIENALEASGSPGVTVRTRCEADWVHLEIENDASALPDRACMPFFSTHPPRLGLGLSVVQRIADRCGGRFALAAADGQVRARLTLRIAEGDRR